MKTKIIFLTGLTLFGCTSGLHAQLYDEAKPIYEAAKSVLESEYAKRKFPLKTIKFTETENLPDTITVNDVRYYNFGKAMRSRQGKVSKKNASTIINIIISDSKISIEEEALFNAVINDRTITVYSTYKYNLDKPVTVTMNADTEVKEYVKYFWENGFKINSFKHMHLTFIDSNNMNNWLDYYYGSKEQKELALAFMQFKILELVIKGEGDFKKRNQLFENFVERIQVKFTLRDRSVYPAASSNLILNIIKEFDEAGYISLPDFVYTDAMEK